MNFQVKAMVIVKRNKTVAYSYLATALGGYYGLDTSNHLRSYRNRWKIQPKRYIQMYVGRVCIRPYRFNFFLLELAGLLSATRGKRKVVPPANQSARPVCMRRRLFHQTSSKPRHNDKY